jgi:L-ascorbate metabolism protein UlaG (beta-lactamase superfamily)
MDASWWIGGNSGRIIIDPWLHGPEIDYAGWFNTQWLQTPPLDYADIPEWDAIVITQKYSDHFHADSLGTLNPSVVYASTRAAKKVNRLLPSATVHTFTSKALRYECGDLTMTYLPTRQRTEPFYDALYIDDGKQGIFFAPHGLEVDAEHLAAIKDRPPCTLLISPYNHYRLPKIFGGTVTPGLAGLEALINTITPKQVSRTHDEPKRSRGIIGRLARIDHVTRERIKGTPWLAPLDLSIPNYEEVEL